MTLEHVAHRRWDVENGSVILCEMAGGATTLSGVHFVYIVRCRDATLYTGYARDPAGEKVYNSGRGARYTAGRRPALLVYSEAFASVGDALRRERPVKRLTRLAKEALIAGATRRREHARS
jgi:putative endonuclease